MATIRQNEDWDATWARAWVCDTTAERMALLAIIPASGGPKRGDMILDNEVGQTFLVLGGGGNTQLTGLSPNPVDLNADVINVLPAANLPPTFDWQDVPFNAADFTGSGLMTWTVASGSVSVNRHGLSYDGKTAVWNFSIGNYTIGGVSDVYLRIAFPFGALPNNFFLGALGFGSDSGVGQVAFAWVAAGGQAYIEIGLMSGTNWVTGAGIGEIDFTVMYEVQP